MAINFTDDIMSLFATEVGNDANYEIPGNFGITPGFFVPAELIDVSINSGGTGYGNAQTFDVTVVGGVFSPVALVNVTTDSGGVVTTINHITNAGSYSVLPQLVGAHTTGDNGSAHGTGITLDLTFGVAGIEFQKVLAFVEVMRALVAETDSTVHLKDIAEIMNKMLMAMKFGSPANYDASVVAQRVLEAAMNYVAKNPTRAGIPDEISD